MPRKNRIHYRHAFYHVMLRGNYRQNLFCCDRDFEDFVNILNKATISFCCEMHLYCLMTNHVHLVIQVSDIPISKIMQCIGSAYARCFNNRYKKAGHLFQGRFKSKLIQDDGYMMELCYYIHMNPIKAGMVISLDEYPWSSHHDYAETKSSYWVTTEHINMLLSQFADINETPYRKFMMTYKDESSQPSFCAFDDEGALAIKNAINGKMQDKAFLALENIPLRKIIRIICEYLEVEMAELSTGSQARKITLARSMITYFSHYHAKYSLEDIAAYFCMQANSISKTLQRHLSQAKQDKAIRKTMEALERRLSISDPDSLML